MCQRIISLVLAVSLAWSGAGLPAAHAADLLRAEATRSADGDTLQMLTRDLSSEEDLPSVLSFLPGGSDRLNRRQVLQAASFGAAVALCPSCVTTGRRWDAATEIPPDVFPAENIPEELDLETAWKIWEKNSPELKQQINAWLIAEAQKRQGTTPSVTVFGGLGITHGKSTPSGGVRLFDPNLGELSLTADLLETAVSVLPAFWNIATGVARDNIELAKQLVATAKFAVQILKAEQQEQIAIRLIQLAALQQKERMLQSLLNDAAARIQPSAPEGRITPQTLEAYPTVQQWHRDLTNIIQDAIATFSGELISLMAPQANATQLARVLKANISLDAPDLLRGREFTIVLEEMVERATLGDSPDASVAAALSTLQEAAIIHRVARKTRWIPLGSVGVTFHRLARDQRAQDPNRLLDRLVEETGSLAERLGATPRLATPAAQIGKVSELLTTVQGLKPVRLADSDVTDLNLGIEHTVGLGQRAQLEAAQLQLESARQGVIIARRDVAVQIAVLLGSIYPTQKTLEANLTETIGHLERGIQQATAPFSSNNRDLDGRPTLYTDEDVFRVHDKTLAARLDLLTVRASMVMFVHQLALRTAIDLPRAATSTKQSNAIAPAFGRRGFFGEFIRSLQPGRWLASLVLLIVFWVGAPALGQTTSLQEAKTLIFHTTTHHANRAANSAQWNWFPTAEQEQRTRDNFSTAITNYVTLLAEAQHHPDDPKWNRLAAETRFELIKTHHAYGNYLKKRDDLPGAREQFQFIVDMLGGTEIQGSGKSEAKYYLKRAEQQLRVLPPAVEPAPVQAHAPVQPSEPVAHMRVAEEAQEHLQEVVTNHDTPTAAETLSSAEEGTASFSVSSDVPSPSLMGAVGTPPPPPEEEQIQTSSISPVTVAAVAAPAPTHDVAVPLTRIEALEMQVHGLENDLEAIRNREAVLSAEASHPVFLLSAREMLPLLADLKSLEAQWLDARFEQALALPPESAQPVMQALLGDYESLLEEMQVLAGDIRAFLAHHAPGATGGLGSLSIQEASRLRAFELVLTEVAEKIEAASRRANGMTTSMAVPAPPPPPPLEPSAPSPFSPIPLVMGAFLVGAALHSTRLTEDEI